MLNLIHIQLDMRVHLQILVMRRMYLVLDILLQIRHLQKACMISIYALPSAGEGKGNAQRSGIQQNAPSFPSARS